MSDLFSDARSPTRDQRGKGGGELRHYRFQPLPVSGAGADF